MTDKRPAAATRWPNKLDSNSHNYHAYEQTTGRIFQFSPRKCPLSCLWRTLWPTESALRSSCCLIAKTPKTAPVAIKCKLELKYDAELPKVQCFFLLPQYSSSYRSVSDKSLSFAFHWNFIAPPRWLMPRAMERESVLPLLHLQLFQSWYTLFIMRELLVSHTLSHALNWGWMTTHQIELQWIGLCARVSLTLPGSKFSMSQMSPPYCNDTIQLRDKHHTSSIQYSSSNLTIEILRITGCKQHPEYYTI